MEDGGIVVGVDGLVSLEDEPSPGVDIFLQADDIGILSLEIAEHGVEAMIVFIVATIGADVVGDELDGAFRQVLTHVDGHE